MKTLEVVFLVAILSLGIFAISFSGGLIPDGGNYASALSSLNSYSKTTYDILFVALFLGIGAIFFAFLNKWNESGGFSQF